MGWKSFVLGTAAGIAGVYAFKKINSAHDLPPERVLAQVKDKFKLQGPISGSWIQMGIEPYERDQIHYKVYKGGISKTVNDAILQYEFIADATTGTILDIHPLTD